MTYLEEKLEKWNRKCGTMAIAVGRNRLYSLYLADDQVIPAEEECQIHYMLRKTDEERKRACD